MSFFEQKKIRGIQSLGEKLTKHRLAKGYSVEKAAKLIKLNVKYLKDLEKNNYNSLPVDVYTINILKKYSELLELNPLTVSETYYKEKALFEKTKKNKKNLLPEANNRFVAFFLNPKHIRNIFFILLFVVLLCYLIWSINRIVSPPILMVQQPADNLITNESNVQIVGFTEKEVTLTINNRPVLTDRNGHFELDIDLQKNLNLIKISATKKYSKEQVVYRRIYVSDDSNQ